MHRSLIVTTSIAVVSLAGCSFDRSGIEPPQTGDAGIPGQMDSGSASGPCPAEIQSTLCIGTGCEPPVQGQPYVHALVGDVIELSAAGSCARSGTVHYRWQISPINGTRETAAPSLDAETLTLLPLQPGAYTVTLTVSAGAVTDTRTVFGIHAHGWEALPGLPGSQEVSDLDASPETLWLATPMGAFTWPLAGGGLISLAEATGDRALSGHMAAVYYDPAANAAWFGHRDARGQVWRVNADQAPPVLAASIESEAALTERAKVQDIAAAAVEAVTGRPVGVAVATDRGITWASDGQTFQGDLEPRGSADIHALAAGPSSLWAGGAELVDITNAAAPIAYQMVAGSGDDKIRALAMAPASAELWVGTAAHGVTRLQPQGASMERTDYGPLQGLQSSDIRALAVERSGPYAGDVWAATANGVARYVRLRDIWITMGNAHGLRGYTDVRAIAVDLAHGRRAVYLGTKNGLVRTAIPTP